MIHFTVSNRAGQKLDTTFYPGLRMVLVGHRLFHGSCPEPDVTRPEWEKIWWNEIIIPFCETKTEIKDFQRGSFSLSFLVIRSSSQFINLCEKWQEPIGKLLWPLQSTSGMTLLSVFLRRIQRAVKGFIRARRQSKRLVLAMAHHARLGSHSILRCLPTDVLVQIY
jgi:hypothetical protein